MPTAPTSRTQSRDLGDVPTRATEVHVSGGLLYDLVVLAGGPASKLSPLCNETAKPMLPIGNRPMLWYVLRPWVDKGIRTVFICAHDYAISAMQLILEREFPLVTFRFVTVPSFRVVRSDVDDDDDEGGSIPSTSCDAVKAYYALKKTLRVEGAPEGQPRDALILSGDTILAKLDIEPFVNNFYASFASANVLLWRPAPPPPKPTADAKQKQPKGAGVFADKKPWQHDYACIAYEDNPNLSVVPPSSVLSSSTSTPSGIEGEPLVEHHRLHYLQPLSDAPTPSVSMGFAARRPNLTFAADVVDAHVYLLRQWVVEFIATVADSHPLLDEIPSLKLDIIPLLARCQHALINTDQRTFLTPLERLRVDKLQSALDADWAIDTSSTRSVGSLSSVRIGGGTADSVRVMCTIYREPASYTEHPQSIRRINSKENYLALHHELVNMLPLPVPVKQKAAVGVAAAPEPEPSAVTAVGVITLEAFHVEHDLVMASAAPDASKHVSQSWLRSAPHSEAYITRSVVGQRVAIGKNVRITNSVILDHTELHDNTTIVNSVICTGVVVREGVSVRNCYAAPQVLIANEVADMVVTSEDG